MTNTATIIRDQLRALDPMAMAAWGAKDLVNMGDGLKFKTSGMVRWKGYVYVKYDEGQDLYNVLFGKVRKAEWIVVARNDGVFVDQLVSVIDAQVG
jgi:hypothetical protein